MLCLSVSIKANSDLLTPPDTTDGWRICLNDTITLEKQSNGDKNDFAAYYFDKIIDSDTIDIFYFTDAPCSNCKSKIELRNFNSIVLKTIDKNLDNSTPFRLTGNELKELLSDNDRVYIYFTAKHIDWRPWMLLGIMKMKK